MRHGARFAELRLAGERPLSARRRRWLRWVFAVIFGAGLAGGPLAAREVPFSGQQVISTEAFGARAVFAADVDGDGDLDALSASLLGDDKIAWYENTDGAGTFGPAQAISTLVGNAASVFAADVDGDGDVDVLSASFAKIAWYENTDGAGTFGEQQVIATPGGLAYSVFAADVDGDGDVDVLSAAYDPDRTAWYENTDGAGTFGPEQEIADLDDPSSVVAADVDGDGDVDVLSAAYGDDRIVWSENTDGAGTFGPEQVITTLAPGTWSVQAADVDGDGDLDVLSASATEDTIAWYENTDGAGTFGSQQVITSQADRVNWVVAADVDGDGDLDVLSASYNDDAIAWYENTDGAGTFGDEKVITTLADGARSVFVGDVDGDGDLDALSASFNDGKIAWYQNETIHRSALFGERRVISNDENEGLWSVFAADVDGDGDADVLSASRGDDKIAWYENTDGRGTFDSQQVITTLAEGASSVFAADVDGDGDADVLSASYDDDAIAWYENTDGMGAFGSQRVISTLADGAESVFAADLDGDGDLDVLSASVRDDKIAWYENTDGAGTFGPPQPITISAQSARSVFAADVDGDGDADVLSASSSDDTIAWYENLIGAGPSRRGPGGFGAAQVITTLADSAFDVYAADVDGDGDVDVLSASRFDDKVAWYENTDGAGTFGPQQVITTEARDAYAVLAADLDVDGDVDVLSAAMSGGEVAWYENTDGAGTFGPPQAISVSSLVRTVYAADVDGDGDLDSIEAYRETVEWHENRGGQFALTTTDVAQLVVSNGQVEDLLRIEVIHKGRPGDSAIELTSVELRLTNALEEPLTEAQALELFQTVRIYLDDGSGVLDDADSLVVASSDLSSIAVNGDGVLTLPLPDDDPLLRVEHGVPRSYLVAVEMTADAEAQSTGAFSLEHRTESSTEAEDADANVPLTLEFVANVQSRVMATDLRTSTCRALLDLNLEASIVDKTVVCEAGTVLSAGDGVTLVAPGDLTLRAGQRIELSDDFTVEGGRLGTEIDPELEP